MDSHSCPSKCASLSYRFAVCVLFALSLNGFVMNKGLGTLLKKKEKKKKKKKKK
jgi:hypothetical protein